MRMVLVWGVLLVLLMMPLTFLADAIL